ncbi:HEAT repeat domain-containing protein [Micromonospora avicenniae]|uniref:HEAT repeat domain-containing protein n=1 Tax=Micromonospora avicenniae TaxID=1198245 RepID=UPI00331D8F4A
MTNTEGVRSSRDRVDFSRLSTAELLAGALREVSVADPDKSVPYLVALHARPTRQVFDVAVRLVACDNPAERELGVRILRELGDHDVAGRRPFSREGIPLLIERLDREADPRVLGWVISALGYNRAREALGDVLRFVDHPHWRVRFHVATALPSLVDEERIEPHAAKALQLLCRDDEADTRYYALVALIEEASGVERELITQTLTDLLNDPDEQVRELVAAQLSDGSPKCRPHESP